MDRSQYQLKTVVEKNNDIKRNVGNIVLTYICNYNDIKRPSLIYEKMSKAVHV